MGEEEAPLKTKCQYIYWNLLVLLEESGDVSATHYIREFAETSRCDAEGKDLSFARRAVINRLGVSTYSKIASFEEGVSETSRALQAMIHYRAWHKELLLKSLNWKLKLKYYTVHKIDRTAQMLGLVGLSYGGVRAAMRAYRALVANPPKPKM